MTLLYYDDGFLQHQTGSHPESATRLEHVVRLLSEQGLSSQCVRPEWQPASFERLETVHKETFINAIHLLALSGGGMFDADTIVSTASFDVACLAAGAVCDAVKRVLTGSDCRSLCLVRPPGHHSLPDRTMGFCLFNNVALAAQTALDEGLERVLIIDWDVHHGNGTQAVFYDDSRVGFFSVHRWPFYPGTGDSDETGTGDGLGTTHNLPVQFGTSQREYREQVQRDLEKFADRIRPELVLVSAGFDAHRNDPVGSLGLDVEDFRWLTKLSVEIARTHSDGRLVSILEGGYNPHALAECVAEHLRVLMEEN